MTWLALSTSIEFSDHVTKKKKKIELNVANDFIFKNTVKLNKTILISRAS